MQQIRKSEICFLILGFLKEEKFIQTYEQFTRECQSMIKSLQRTPGRSVKSLSSILNEYIVFKEEKKNKDAFVNALSLDTKIGTKDPFYKQIQSSLDNLYTMLDDYSSFRNDLNKQLNNQSTNNNNINNGSYHQQQFQPPLTPPPNQQLESKKRKKLDNNNTGQDNNSNTRFQRINSSINGNNNVNSVNRNNNNNNSSGTGTGTLSTSTSTSTTSTSTDIIDLDDINIDQSSQTTTIHTPSKRTTPEGSRRKNQTPKKLITKPPTFTHIAGQQPMEINPIGVPDTSTTTTDNDNQYQLSTTTSASNSNNTSVDMLDLPNGLNEFGKSLDELLNNPHIHEKIADYINQSINHQSNPSSSLLLNNNNQLFEQQQLQQQIQQQEQQQHDNQLQFDQSTSAQGFDYGLLEIDSIIQSIEADPEIGGYLQNQYQYHQQQQIQHLTPTRTSFDPDQDLTRHSNISPLKQFDSPSRSNSTNSLNRSYEPLFPNTSTTTSTTSTSSTLQTPHPPQQQPPSSSSSLLIPENIDDFLSTLSYDNGHDEDD